MRAKACQIVFQVTESYRLQSVKQRSRIGKNYSMQKLTRILLIAALCFGGSIATFAIPQNPAYTQTREARKAQKKQERAIKKYQKKQRKAQNKMFKESQKKTHYPKQQF